MDAANRKSFLAYLWFETLGQSNQFIAYGCALGVNYYTKKKSHGQPYHRMLPYNFYFPFDVQDHYVTAWLFEFTTISYVLWNLVCK